MLTSLLDIQADMEGAAFIFAAANTPLMYHVRSGDLKKQTEHKSNVKQFRPIDITPNFYNKKKY